MIRSDYQGIRVTFTTPGNPAPRLGIYLGNLRDERGDILQVVANLDAGEDVVNLLALHPSHVTEV